MRIIARSRIGFWTAFETDGGAYLNVRDGDGGTASIVLTDADIVLLEGDAAVCHAHALRLARAGLRLDTPLPTPPRGTQEPEPHEWQPRKPVTTSAMLRAA